jgi:hypothetical protein
MAHFGKFDRFLEKEANEPGNRRFIARNFLLDEGLSASRISAYNDLAATDGITTRTEWKDRHEQYLTERIKLPRPPDHILPRSIDPTALRDCPETFGEGAAFCSFGATDPAYDLIRIEKAERMARFAPRPDQFIGLVEEYLACKREEAGRVISATISFWRERRDLRPVFAAFWYGVRDLLEGGPDDWADQLRDRLGLIRFNPVGVRKLAVLVFRYPVRLVPKLADARSESRALAVPTVLDGEWSASFCPVPSGQEAGFAVDLSAGLEHLAQEIVHPQVHFGVEHLCRIGYISRRAPEDLSEAHRYHLLWLQEISGRHDYALMTDGDLLR